MHWEWRVFSSAGPSNSLPSELWSLIELSPSKKEPERTDVYLTCTPGAGLKLRGGREVEVKLRQAVAHGGAEAWTKVVKTRLPRDVDSQDPVAVSEVFKQKLLEIQYEIDKSGVKESLENAVAALSRPQQFVTVTKSRIKKHAFRLSVESVEEAIVSVCVREEPTVLWRSVCVEGSRPEDINKMLATRVTSEGGTETSLREHLSTSGIVQAYPEFIVQRASKLTTHVN